MNGVKATWENIEFYLKRRVYIHNGHWLWTKCKEASGYGNFRFNGEMVKAHRVSYIVFVGPIPEDRPCILHKNECNIKHCINPEHLYAGTKLDNVRDCIAIGAFVQNTNTKLSDEVVSAIRQRAAMGEQQKDIAQDYKITPEWVCILVNHRRRS